MFPLSAEEPESNRKLHHLLNVVTEALVWVIAKSGIPSQQQTTRLANLLMLLSHVRHARYSSQSVCNTCVMLVYLFVFCYVYLLQQKKRGGWSCRALLRESWCCSSPLSL